MTIILCLEAPFIPVLYISEAVASVASETKAPAMKYTHFSAHAISTCVIPDAIIASSYLVP